MAIKYLAGKRATALKSDIISDSLGSSADGVNNGITQSGSAPTGFPSTVQGYNGGTSEMNSGYGTGGGGGSGAVGKNESSTGSGDGGIGKTSSITGTSKYYSAGGGGGMHSGGDGIRGIGGLGGGGKAGYSAIQNTGSGAGGMSLENANSVSGNGGAGQVILKFPTSGTSYTATDDTISYLDNVGGNTKQLDESANKYGVCLHGNSQLVGKKLKSIAFNMKKNNSPTGNMNVKIYRESTIMQDWTEFEKVICNSSGNVATPYMLSTTANNTSWVLRFTVRYNRVWSANSYVYIGLSNSDGGYNVAQNFLGTLFRKGSSENNFGVHTVQNAQPDSVNSQDQQSNSTSTDTEYYFEIVRTSATECVVKRYTDRSYSSVASSSTSTYSSVSESCTGLDRIKVFALNASNSEAQVHVTDVMFYNGVTSVSVSGSASATSANVSASGLGGSFAETPFAFSGSDIIELKAGDRIVFEGGSHDGTDQIQFENNARPFLHDVHMARYTSSWVDLFPNSPLFKVVLDPSPDTTSSSGNTILRFLSSGTFTLSGGTPNVEYLVLGGGGATGSQVGGGGGAGGFVTGTKSSMANGSYTVTIGAGGISGASSGWSGNGASEGTASSSNGGNSVFSDITAYGGGAGASNDSNSGNGEDGWDGASGGGASYRSGKTKGDAIYNSGAYSFDGTDDYVTAGSTSSWNFLHDGSGGTVSAWVKRNASDGGGIFITEGGQSTTTGFGLGIRSGGNAYARTINTSNQWQVCEDTSSSVSTGVWHHILATIDSSSIKLYVDGTLNSSHTISGTLKSGNSTYNTIGRDYDGSSWSYLTTDIDDIGIWNRVLTATEIGKLANNNSAAWDGSQGGDSGYVSFDGTTCKISSASGIDSYAYGLDMGLDITGNYCLDFEFTMDSNTYVAQYQACGWLIGLWSANSAPSGENPTNSNYEFARVNSYTSGDPTVYARYRNGSSADQTSSQEPVFTLNSSTAQVRYGRLVRNGSNIHFSVFDDSGRTSQLGSTVTQSTTSGQTLRYLAIKQFTQSSSNTWNFTFDNVKLYNGQTTATGSVTKTVDFTQGDAQLVSSLTDKSELKANYTMDSTSLGATKTAPSSGVLPTGSSTTGWTLAGTTISSNNLNFDAAKQSTENSGVYELSEALSDEKWVLRFKYTISNLTNVNASNINAFIGLFSTTGTFNTNQDYMGLSYISAANSNYFWAGARNDAGIDESSSSNRIYDGSVSATTYYVEIKRKSATTGEISIGTNSDFVTGRTTMTTWLNGLNANITGLKYVGYKNRSNVPTLGGSVFNGTLSDFEIYNGVSSVDGCKNDYSDASPIPNSQTNTIVEATDDGNHYIWTGSAWTKVP